MIWIGVMFVVAVAALGAYLALRRRYSIMWQEAKEMDAEWSAARDIREAAADRHARAREVIARHGDRFGWSEERRGHELRHALRRGIC